MQKYNNQQNNEKKRWTRKLESFDRKASGSDDFSNYVNYKFI